LSPRSLIISLVTPDPRPFPRIVTTVLIGLGGAAIASGITGFLEVESGEPQSRATALIRHFADEFDIFGIDVARFWLRIV
jgi:hypothetical protein